MTSPGGYRVFWMIVLVIVLGANLGENKKRKQINVPFPPALPTEDNLASICANGNGRPRYPDSFFPASGFSHFRRRGKAINCLESWYSGCCGDPNVTLCCAEQAWKKALSQFCTEEYSVKTMVYECCEYKGDARWACFNSDLPNPNYNPVPDYTAPEMPAEPGFTFDPNAC